MGAAATLQVTLTLNTPGSYTNQVTVSGTSPANTVVSDDSDAGTDPDPNGNGDPTEPGENDPTPLVLSENPVIGAAKGMSATGSGPYAVTIDYTFENFGNVVLSSLTASEDLSAVFGVHGTDWTFVGISSVPVGFANVTYDGHGNNELIATGQSLAVGAAATLQVTLTLNTPGSYTNQVTVSGTSPANTVVSDDSDAGTDPDPNGNGDPTEPGENDPTPLDLTGQPQIDATKTDALLVDDNSNGQVDPGDGLLYTVVITNSGNADATGVQFQDTPDSNTTLNSGTVTTTQGAVLVGNTAGDTSVTVDVGTIPSASNVTITFEVSVNDPLPDGVNVISNQGLVQGDNFEDELTDDPDTPSDDDPTDTPIGLYPFIEAYKSAALTGDKNGNGLADPGDVLTYTVSIENSGNADAINLVYTDTPDSNTRLIVGSATVSDPAALMTQDTSITVQIPTLAPAASVIITYDVRINKPLSAGVNRVVNQGMVRGDNLEAEPTDDPGTQRDDDPTVVPIGSEQPGVIPMPDITYFDPAISKVGILQEGGLGLPGEKLTWMVTITNIGTAAGFDVVIVDEIQSELRVDGADIDRGTASVNSQAVTFIIPTLNPGESIQARIYTTILESPLDGMFDNTVVLQNYGKSASAAVPALTQLPSTGYSPMDEPQHSTNTAMKISVALAALGTVVLLGLGIKTSRNRLRG